ncbi:DMT family transporter [Camelimonas lactis]|uniref:EamA-like transporter family protein n=1 Tax=Camelimonas lactis TaxID=659006 RepID=A0A4V2RX57_9HYPH|nr:DMT family transporter [Camelimonas lactis]TCO11815.1 EamA-like transporter family protein [Camelimonas lactis]
MLSGPAIWIAATLAATGAQTARNAMQGSLVGAIGAAGATQVRFIYGFPFACLFLAVVTLVTGETPPAPGLIFFLYVLGGAVAQIFGTAMMLWAISQRSFATGIAYTKTEPVLVALFSVIVLGDHLGLMAWAGVLVASAGVIIMSLKPQRGTAARVLAGPDPAAGAGRQALPPGWRALPPGWRAPGAGVASAALFALSSVWFRGAILALGDGGFVIRASTALVASLGLQCVMLGLWLGLFDRAAFMGSVRVWRASLTAGLMGALASQCWFIGFSLTSAANVRTLALLEVVFAQIVSRRVFHEAPGLREIAGAAMIVAGVAALLATWG